MKSEELYALAVKSYENKDFKSAQEYALKALAKNKKCTKSLNLLGVLAAERKEYKAAEAYYKNKANIKNPQSFCNLGNLYLTLGNFNDARQNYLKALELEPFNIQALYNLGVAYKECKNYDKAKELFKKAILIDNNFANAHLNLGLIAKLENDYKLALQEYDICLNLGLCVNEAKLNIAVIKTDLKDYDEAKRLNLEVLDADPNNYMARNNLGRVYKELGYFEEALGHFANAVALNPIYGEAYSNIAICLHELRQPERAKAAALKSIELSPESGICFNNLGFLLKSYGDLNASLQCFERAFELEPQDVSIRVGFGIALLTANHYENGLKLYSARPISRLVCDRPFWNKEDLSDKTILVYHEQGLGDTIQFARFLPLLVKKAKKVLFLPQEPLVKLYENSTLNVQIVNKQELLDGKIDFDYHTALLDLMINFEIFNPKETEEIAYININHDKKKYFASKLTSGFKIGIAWQGNKAHTEDRSRSAKLENFAHIASIKGVQLVSLQKEIDINEIDEFRSRGYELLDFSNELNSFDDTAALIDELDMVICVDTSVAHLAATLQKSTWILTSFCPDWRWGFESTTPWYKSVKLFRRSDIFDWRSTFEAVADELKKLRL